MAPRIFGIRLLDLLASIVALWLLFYYRLKKNNLGATLESNQTKSMILALVCVFPVAIVSHALVGQPTALNHRLGLSPAPLTT